MRDRIRWIGGWDLDKEGTGKHSNKAIWRIEGIDLYLENREDRSILGEQRGWNTWRKEGIDLYLEKRGNRFIVGEDRG